MGLIVWGIFQNSTSSSFEVWFRFEESRLVRFRQLLQLGANFSPNCRGKTIKRWWKIWEFPLKVRSSQPRQRDSVDGSDIQWLHHLSKKNQVLSYLHFRYLKFLGDDFHPKMVPFPENGCLEYLPAFLLGPLFPWAKLLLLCREASDASHQPPQTLRDPRILDP